MRSARDVQQSAAPASAPQPRSSGRPEPSVPTQDAPWPAPRRQLPRRRAVSPPCPPHSPPARSGAATHARIPLPAPPPLRLDGASAATETSPAGAGLAGNAAPLSASRKSPRRRGVGGRPGAPGSERRGGRNRAQTPSPPTAEPAPGLGSAPSPAPYPAARLAPPVWNFRALCPCVRRAPARERGGAGPFCAGLRAARSSLPRSFSSAPFCPLFPSQSPHASGFKRGWPVCAGLGTKGLCVFAAGDL